MYGNMQTKRSDIGVEIGQTFVSEGTLPFRIMNARDSDYLTFQGMGSELNLKVKTPAPPSLRLQVLNQYNVVIDNVRYKVVRGDRDQHYLYFYLDKIGGLSDDN